MKAAQGRSSQEKKILLEITMRASVINQAERVTGDGIINVTNLWISKTIEKNNRRILDENGLYQAFLNLVSHQTLNPEDRQSIALKKSRKNQTAEVAKLVTLSIELLKEHRDGI